MGHVHTVQGLVASGELGLTLMHEHCLVDGTVWWKGQARELWKRERFAQPVGAQNRGEVIYNNFWFRDNLVQTDINIAIEELRYFMAFGGRSLVDLTQDSTGRDPNALRYISQVTGAHLVMGSGLYIEESLTEEERRRSPRDTANLIVAEFRDGVRGTGVRPGIIGEIGVADVRRESEMNNLRAAAMAQREIGCALNVHPPIWETKGNEILDVLEEEGADLSRVIMSHCDPTLREYGYHNSLAKRGCYIEYDMFGLEIMTHEGWFLPSDGEKIEAVKRQVDLGNLDRLLVSGDMCFKICFRQWGGWGYSHIPEHVVPRLRQAGLSAEQVHQITVENPARALSF